MGRVFIDTNVVLDYLMKRSGYEVAEQILTAGFNRLHEVYISSLSDSNIAYIARKEFRGEALYMMLSGIMEMVECSPVDGETIAQAIKLRADDFEDAVQYASAKGIGAECIVTRNKRDFSFAGDIAVLTPEEFVLRLT